MMHNTSSADLARDLAELVSNYYDSDLTRAAKVELLASTAGLLAACDPDLEEAHDLLCKVLDVTSAAQQTVEAA